MARAIALDLVTRYRLRLTDPRDSRLGELQGGAFELGAAMWTGRRAVFVGFYTPPSDPSLAGPDLAARCAAAARWAAQRLVIQGAERCDVLLVALGSVPGSLSAPPSAANVQVGAVTVTPSGEVSVLLPIPPELPNARDIKARVDMVNGGREPPTLAAVDLAERQTVAGGYAQPAQRQLTSRPMATYGLIASFVIVFILEKLLIRSGGLGQVGLLDMGALVGLPVPANDQLPADWWRFVSSTFLHDPGTGFGGLPVHVLFNCVATLFVGRLVEQLYGWRVLLATFIITGVGAGLIWAGWNAVTTQPAGLSIGASGGITGLLGLLVVLGRFQGKDVPVGIAHAMRQYALTYSVMIVLFGFLVANVNNLAHIGGFITGAAVGVVLPPLRHVGGRDLHRRETAGIYVVYAVAAAALLFAAINVVSALGSSPGLTTGPLLG